MYKRLLALTFVSLILHAVIAVQPAAASSRSEKQALFAEKVRLGVLSLGVGEEARIEIKLRDITSESGYVSEMTDDRFSVANAITGASTDIAYSNVAQIRGNNLSTGAKIAIGIAIGVGATLIVLAIYLNCCTG